ncbi:unnamed protein product, partial [Bubo scandiacus]
QPQTPPRKPPEIFFSFWGKCLPPRSTRHSSQASPSSFRICFKDLRSQVAAPDSPRKATCVVFSPVKEEFCSRIHPRLLSGMSWSNLTSASSRPNPG